MEQDHRTRTTISPEAARQGRIVLRRKWQRVAFAAGLASAVVLALLLGSAYGGS